MFTHIVLLKPKETVSVEEIVTALQHVQELPKKIPEIKDVRVGKNQNSLNDKGYTYGFVMHFENAEQYKKYGPHPAHQPVSQELQHICDNIIDFDIE